MKRRLTTAFSLLVIFALLFISFGSFSQPAAHAALAPSCTVISDSTTSLVFVPVTVGAGAVVTATVSTSGFNSISIELPSTPTTMGSTNASATALAAGSGMVTISAYTFPGPTGIAFSYTITICGGKSSTATTPVPPLFTDGRCNIEPDQSVAVYPDGSGGYKFYALYNSVGYFALHLTKADLDANPDTGKNYLIEQSKGVKVWRLAGGALQVQRLKADGNLYEFIWTGC